MEMERMKASENMSGIEQIWRSAGKNTNLLSLRSDVKRKGFVSVEAIFMCVASNVLAATAADHATNLTCQREHSRAQQF